MRSDHLKKHQKIHLKDNPRKINQKIPSQKPCLTLRIKPGSVRTIKQEEIICDSDENFNEPFEEKHEFTNQKTGKLSFGSSRQETVFVSNGEVFQIRSVDEDDEDFE